VISCEVQYRPGTLKDSGLSKAGKRRRSALPRTRSRKPCLTKRGRYHWVAETSLWASGLARGALKAAEWENKSPVWYQLVNLLHETGIEQQDIQSLKPPGVIEQGSNRLEGHGMGSNFHTSTGASGRLRPAAKPALNRVGFISVSRKYEF
jgi:hypothetical protein